MKKKNVLVNDGQNGFFGETKAETEKGYIQAARRLWPYTGLTRLRVKVLADNQIIFETVIDLA